ncbi:MAG: hypothetical protein EPO67_25170 [Reyranella sp.]|nr:MAG: hypothetical protein EPO67_25170 [Reyranella sp.]
MATRILIALCLFGAMAGVAGAQTAGSSSGSGVGTSAPASPAPGGTSPTVPTNPAPGAAIGTGAGSTAPGAPTAGQPGIGLDTDRRAMPAPTR